MYSRGLFLPVYEYEIRFFPEYNKMTATCLGVFCATLLFDSDRILRFRPKLMDFPMVVLCVSPLISSLTNGLGAYNGGSDVFKEGVKWMLPYFLGRIYFNDMRGMRELAIGIFLGGLVYVPLCLFEIRFSPQLHRLFYGFHPSGFTQVVRMGGYRPTVFLIHGLMVGMWMTAASLCGFWLWQTRSIQRLFGLPMWLLVLVLTRYGGAVQIHGGHRVVV